MVGVTLTWLTSQNCEDSEIINILDQFGAEKSEIRSQYQKWVRKGVNFTITRFENKLMIQGKVNDSNINLIKELSQLNSLELDGKSLERYRKLSRFSNNAIVCTECNDPSILITGQVIDSKLLFTKECNHKIDMKPPIMVFTSRIIPDICILVSRLLTKLIYLGYFEDFEIVIPNNVLDIIEILCGPNEKKGALKEIDMLIEMEKEGKIKTFNCKYGKSLPPKEELEIEEDNFILDLAKLTNSILFTSDGSMTRKARLRKMPVIYIDPKFQKDIKDILNSLK